MQVKMLRDFVANKKSTNWGRQIGQLLELGPKI